MASPSPSITFHLPGPGFTFRARLLVNDNPDVLLGQVVIVGETFWTPTRIVHLGHNHMIQRHRGAVYLNGPGQSICITYGKITESAKINKFAEMFEEDLPKLEEIGKLVYQQTVALPRHTLIEVHISSECCPRLKGPESHPIDRVWLKEPVEVQKIRWGVIESGAGKAYLMLLGGDVMSYFLKIAQYEEIQLPVLKRITKEFLVENFDLFEFMSDLELESMFQIGQL
ncbi:hypothetical protein BJY01DRAFT_234349 [Aspergillus pseudoustus]|uniref:Uncharacterized protein n=1 Tax=Aspergillus pseudoustus TaxID=1810923 RepID=A0ABR4K554_9EURO